MQRQQYEIESYFGYIDTVEDAMILAEAARQSKIKRVQRRLTDRERLLIRCGSVFVFVEGECGIRRWTDGKLWSPSRIFGQFLVYKEVEKRPKRMSFKTESCGNVEQGWSVPPLEADASSSSSSQEDFCSSFEVDAASAFKKGGLIKKTISINFATGESLHIVSYSKYLTMNNMSMVGESDLLTPSRNMNFKDISPVLVSEMIVGSGERQAWMGRKKSKDSMKTAWHKPILPREYYAPRVDRKESLELIASSILHEKFAMPLTPPPEDESINTSEWIASVVLGCKFAIAIKRKEAPAKMQATVNIKCSNDVKYSLSIELCSTVGELKSKIEAEHGIPAQQQRLIFSGKVLKDGDTLEGCKVADGNTLHLVRSSPANSASAATAPTSATSATPAANTNTPLNPMAASMFNANPAINPPAMSPEMLRMSMQLLASNPQLMEQLMSSNPMFQQMPPHMRAMMTSPQMMQQMMDPAFIESMSQMMQEQGGQQMPQMPGFGAPISAAPAANPEITYASQLQQLQDMGFYDAQENIRALQMVSGNVSAAIEFLLSRRFQ